MISFILSKCGEFGKMTIAQVAKKESDVKKEIGQDYLADTPPSVERDQFRIRGLQGLGEALLLRVAANYPPIRVARHL